jgi:hypothetical protein
MGVLEVVKVNASGNYKVEREGGGDYCVCSKKIKHGEGKR